ncbi:hypothetical protein [Novosphingopyxis baekryungensis]|uniref:hypothetical protein n=1 Tax=Novosphingopyxis baekryungensis TaxID=279369 RepID=UPI0003B37E4A|nr:hypothetical protein [Novosphingopyxis baekryungensis]
MSDLKPIASLSSSLLARKGAARPAMRRPAPSHRPSGLEQDDLGWNDMGYDVDPDPDAQDERGAFRQNPLMGAIPHSDPEQSARIREVKERLNIASLPTDDALERAASDAEAPMDVPQSTDNMAQAEAANDRDVIAPQTEALNGADVLADDSALAEETLAEETMAEPTLADTPAQPLLASKPRTKPKPSVPQATQGKPRVAAQNKAAFTLRLDPDRHLKLRLACAVRNVSAQKLVTAALDEMLAGMPELNELTRHVPARSAEPSS